MADVQQRYLITLDVDAKDLALLKTQLKQFESQIQTTPQKLTNFNNGMRSSVLGARQFGGQLSNVSYQLTDFIVQVQGGIPVLRSFSQQAPQLLAGFGALGAALGVVAALLPVGVQLFKSYFGATADSAAAAKQLEDALKQMNDELGKSENLLKLAAQAGGDLGANLRTAALNKVKLELIEFNENLLKNTAAYDVLQQQIKLYNSSLGQSAQREFNEQLKEAALELGLSESSMEKYISLLHQLRSASDPDTMKSLLEYLSRLNAEWENPAVQRVIEAYAEMEAKLRNVSGEADKAADSINGLNEALKAGSSLAINYEVAALESAMLSAGASIEETDRAVRSLRNSLESETYEVYRAKEAYANLKDANDAYRDSLKETAKGGTGGLTDAQRELNAMFRDYERLMDSVKTEAEKLAEIEKKLLALRDANRINQEQYNAALAVAKEKYKEGADAAEEFAKMQEQANERTADAVTGFFTAWADGSKSFKEAAKDMLKQVLTLQLQLQVLKALSGTSFGNFLGIQAANGGAFSGMSLPPGVYNQPTKFGFGSRLTPYARGGLLGEQGAEAVLPLRRAANGQLGVQSSGGGTTVNVYNNAPATEVKTREESDGSLSIIIEKVREALSTDVARGGSRFTKSLESAYGVSRARGSLI